jgi:DNA-binding NarL/FixJ family response regulator
MGLQAGAARRVLASQPEKATEALAQIETSSRQAVVELQQLLGFLRHQDQLVPQPTLAQLNTLVIEAFVSLPAGVTRASELEQLTEREVDVLKLLMRGQSNDEIAQSLTITPGTTKTHVSNLLGKLGLRDRTQAVVFACESGLVKAGTA